jgi:hypothetical protein
MHYIRFLRPPKLVGARKNARLELLFTVTTDLGDAFMIPETPIKLIVSAYAQSSSTTANWRFSGGDQLVWNPGQRVSRPILQLPPAAASAFMSGEPMHICIRSEDMYSAESAENIILNAIKPEARVDELGLVMPVWIPFNQSQFPDHVSIRKLELTGTKPLATIEVFEEIGESIARHVWDAGVVALSAIAMATVQPAPTFGANSCMQAIGAILRDDDPLTILELGCGVGILGLGVVAAHSRLNPDAKRRCTLLMTDIEEAEQQARSNISRSRSAANSTDLAELLYENLDWEDGRQHVFGPLTSSRRWDLIILSDCTYNVDMLPALVETLSALHDASMKHAKPDSKHTTKVFLATKPRHSSERALFGLMTHHGWTQMHEQVVPLPLLGSEAETVELYMFEKS